MKLVEAEQGIKTISEYDSITHAKEAHIRERVSALDRCLCPGGNPDRSCEIFQCVPIECDASGRFLEQKVIGHLQRQVAAGGIEDSAPVLAPKVLEAEP